MKRRDIHGMCDHDAQGGGCHDAWCCACECRACKRAWFAAGRPSPDDCPEHGEKKSDLDVRKELLLILAEVRQIRTRSVRPMLEERVELLERAVQALLILSKLEAEHGP